VNREEAVLRELNLYPLWKLRAASAQAQAAQSAAAAPQTVTPLNTQVQAAALTAGVDELNWADLQARVRGCTLCPLRAGCKQTVFGVGDEQADWLFVGEGPGADEDAKGEPFVGQAGRLLDNMLAAIKLKRGKNVYIANIVKCRPPGNRTPTASEIASCLPYLRQQIALIRPRLIVALGKTAATALLGNEAALSSLRGRMHAYQGIPLVITYHPAYLLRTPADKARTWQDLCLAVEAMNSQKG
jgi:uracil-DNA glycosylase family 4